MPLEHTTAQATPQGQIHARDFDLTLIDHLGNKHTLEPRGSLLVLDPALAVACEVQGYEYVYVNLAHIAAMAVMAAPAAAPLLLTAPATELLEEQLNGAGEAATLERST